MSDIILAALYQILLHINFITALKSYKTNCDASLQRFFGFSFYSFSKWFHRSATDLIRWFLGMFTHQIAQNSFICFFHFCSKWLTIKMIACYWPNKTLNRSKLIHSHSIAIVWILQVVNTQNNQWQTFNNRLTLTN